MPLVAIRSCSTGKYLSLNGANLHRPQPDGGGSVSLQSHVQGWETFKLNVLGNGIVAFESSTFRNVYLRFDGSQVQAGKTYKDGAGTVNAQYTLGAWEQFTLKLKQDTGIVALESKEFPGRFVRAVGNTVNGQGNFGSGEEFQLVLL
ncbi:hypothetical protein CPB86DRAFT_672536, partial [Serendipita vermifera]